jgi:hypothetical protein
VVLSIQPINATEEEMNKTFKRGFLDAFEQLEKHLEQVKNLTEGSLS